MQIATFNATTEWQGRRITREGDAFLLEGHGPVTAAAIMQHDRQAHLIWTNDGTRAWVGSLAARAAPPSTTRLPVARPGAVARPVTGSVVDLQLPAFCWSCGAWPSAGAVCPECNAALTPLVSRPRGRLGNVYQVRKGFAKKPAIVVAESGEMLTLHVSRGAEMERAHQLLGSPLTSLRASHSRAWSLLSGATVDGEDWDRDRLLERAVEIDGADSQLRLSVADVLRCSREDLLPKLPVSDSARAWYTSLLRASRGDAEGALEALSRLPAQRYPAKVVVVLRCWSTLASKPKLRRQTEALLEGVRDASPAVRMILDVLSGRPELTGRLMSVDSLVVLLDSLADGSPPSPKAAIARSALSRMAKSFSQESSDLPKDLGVRGPACDVLGTLSGCGPGLANAPPGYLATLPKSVLDDLVDQGSVAAEVIDRFPTCLTRTYLLARLRPARLTDSEIDELGFTRERARRALAHGDHNAVTAMGDDPGAADFCAISGLLRGEYHPVPELSGVEPLLRDKLQALAACAQVGGLEPATVALVSDSRFWPVLRRWADGAGIAPAVKSEQGREFLAVAKLHEVKAALYAWEWEEALALAKQCLSMSRAEATRDEALNIMAAIHWQLGNDEAAIQALEQAIDNEHSSALQANIGVVSQGEDPAVGAHHLARLVLESASPELREAAALRAVEMWGAAASTYDDDDPEAEMPEELVHALRSVVAGPMTIDSFRRLVRLMASVDAEWLGRRASLQTSPHRQSVEARVYAARAKGIDEFILSLAAALRERPQLEWLIEERDGLVGALMTGLSKTPAETWAVMLGLEVIEAKMPLEAATRIPLTGLAVAGVAESITPGEGEPKDKFLDMLLQAKSELASLPAERREYAEFTVNLGFAEIASAVGAYRDSQLTEGFEIYNKMRRQIASLGRGYSVNHAAVREATDPIMRFCTDTCKVLDKITPHLEDKDLADALRALRSESERLYHLFAGLPR